MKLSERKYLPLNNTDSAAVVSVDVDVDNCQAVSISVESMGLI